MDARFSHGIKKIKVIAHFYNLYFFVLAIVNLYLIPFLTFIVRIVRKSDINVEVQEKQSEL